MLPPMMSTPLNAETVNPDVTLADLDKLCGKFHISGLPVVDHENKLVGIITNRDMRFIPSEDYDHLRVRDVMTKENLITGPANISKADAHDLLAKFKIEKLPLVDSEGHLTGLITVKAGQMRGSIHFGGDHIRFVRQQQHIVIGEAQLGENRRERGVLGLRIHIRICSHRATI